MSDYEIIGRLFMALGSVMLVLLAILGVLKMAWFIFQEIVGWLRIARALRMLRDSEQRERP